METVKNEENKVLGEVFKIQRTKPTHYKTSNKFTICYLISLGFKYEEDVEKNIYNGKTSYIFAFRNDQEGFIEAMDIVKSCRAEKKHLPFPEVDGKQLTFKTANKERWAIIELNFPELRRD